ncbi:hypothetical protein BC833DRAFT_653991 [Globomyces pollinis-pini]|nr:hypothetical protein BC833DRAFT_653991 [Globomyces pollinis-pini]
MELIKKMSISEEIVTINRDAGYRAIHRALRMKHNIFVSRKMVMELLKEIDPDGVELRKRHKLKRRQWYSAGPNYHWCLDGHDKTFVSYGLAIHGCIDAWSGKIIWLRAWSTNKNPALVLKFYLEAIKELKVIPFKTRSDPGTENVDVAKIQSALHIIMNDDYSTSNDHEYCRSQLNQKIESLWYRYLRSKGYHIMDILRDIYETADFNEDDALDSYLHLYLWIPLLQKYLDEFRNEMRQKSKTSILPNHQPNYCYQFPEKFDGIECGIPVKDMEILNNLISENCSDYFVRNYIPEDFKWASDKAFAALEVEHYDTLSVWDVFTRMRAYLLSFKTS